jgi:hypothetical protein
LSKAKAHLDSVASLSCCLCGDSPVEIHHILEGRVKGRRCGDWTTLPLCPDCHRGSLNGIHGQRNMLKVKKTTELELLNETLERIYG